MKQLGAGVWVHTQCSLMHPSITMDRLTAPSATPASCCSLCKKPSKVLFECSHPSCKVSFHVSCAVKSKVHGTAMLFFALLT